MKKIILTISLIGIINLSTADEMEPINVYYHMSEILKGEWSLSPADKQVDTTGAYKNKAVLPLVGTDTTAIAYKIIARGTTLQEDLLPNTKKQMVTMYHCNSINDCIQLKATHYCAKRNQPEFLLNIEETTEEKIVFDCNMKIELCNSDEDHVHKIIHELSKDSKHLKSSYLGWKIYGS